MDLRGLQDAAALGHGRKNFYRIINHLEAQGMVKTWRDPFNKKKYAYLTPAGQAECWDSSNSVAVKQETLLHDLKVSEIAREFLRRSWAHDVELEHELRDKASFRTSFAAIPDAVFVRLDGRKQLRIAFELELNRKSTSRLVEKANQYLDRDSYRYAFYFFTQRHLRDFYYKTMREALGPPVETRLMFFCHEGMMKDGNDLATAKGLFKGNEVALGALFEGKDCL